MNWLRYLVLAGGVAAAGVGFLVDRRPQLAVVTLLMGGVVIILRAGIDLWVRRSAKARPMRDT